MNVKVVVLGAGYAGTGTIQRLEKNIGGSNGVDITWVSENDYHLVLHESHRVIRDPSVKERITF
ncbi:MAG: NAD(P)/FAD-dependent oxidoreductase, partial [Halobacteria archaeon]|nr:NAD(P)/FAD-dependent oxidoreductase [Halobacteria archaeon]